MVGADQPHVEGIELLGRPLDVLHRADAGGGAIDRLARSAMRVLDDDARHPDPNQRFGIGAQRDAALADLGEGLEAQGLAVELEGSLLHEAGNQLKPAWHSGWWGPRKCPIVRIAGPSGAFGESW